MCNTCVQYLGTSTKVIKDILPPTGGSNVQCKHHWIFQETNKCHKPKEDKYGKTSVIYQRLDRYYCENCCEIKELIKTETVDVRIRNVGYIESNKPVWY